MHFYWINDYATEDTYLYQKAEKCLKILSIVFSTDIYQYRFYDFVEEMRKYISPHYLKDNPTTVYYKKGNLYAQRHVAYLYTFSDLSSDEIEALTGYVAHRLSITTKNFFKIYPYSFVELYMIYNNLTEEIDLFIDALEKQYAEILQKKREEERLKREAQEEAKRIQEKEEEEHRKRVEEMKNCFSKSCALIARAGGGVGHYAYLIEEHSNKELKTIKVGLTTDVFKRFKKIGQEKACAFNNYFDVVALIHYPSNCTREEETESMLRGLTLLYGNQSFQIGNDYIKNITQSEIKKVISHPDLLQKIKQHGGTIYYSLDYYEKWPDLHWSY